MGKHSAHISTKDFAVSGEIFEIVESSYDGILQTYPRPKEDVLSDYYKSDNYISHTDGKRNLFEFAYHVIRRKALRRKLKLINKYASKTKNLLDVGCGTGDFLAVAQKDGWQVTGVEPSSKARDIANAKTAHSVYDINYLDSLKPNMYDVITLWHVLEHLPNLERHIKVLKHLLKPNGQLIIAVPNYKSFDATYYGTYWAAYDVPRHLWHFSKKGIKQLFLEYSFKLEDTFPMRFDAYYVSLLSEKYKSGFMNPLKAFWVGWRSNHKAKANQNYSSLIYSFKNC